MKKKNQKAVLTYRVVAVIISIVMIVGMFPLTVFAAEENDNIVNSLNAFNNPTGTVDDYSTGENPYGYGNGQVFTMSAQSELYRLYSYDLNKKDGEYVNNYFYQNFSVGSVEDGISSAKMSGITPTDGISPYSARKWLTSPPGENYILYHMQAVAFDPFNSGRDDHIAFLGIDKAGSIQVYVMDANTGKLSNMLRLGAEGAGQHLIGNKMQAYEASNYLAITAGRYTAYDESKPQQGETLVVYAPEYKGLPTLREFTVTLSGGALVVAQKGSGSSYLQYDYRVGTYGKRMQAEGDVNDSLMVSLATGDFDGDRVDDLAVLSSVSDVDGEYSTVSYQYFMPELYVAFGGGNGTILNRSAAKKEIAIWNDDNTEMRTFTSPGLTAGDLDGDGIDDIIAAGWQLVATKESNKSSINDHHTVSGVTVAAYSGLKKAATQMVLTHFDNADDSGKSGNIFNHWSKGVYEHGAPSFQLSASVFVYPKYVVEAVAINGGSAADMIFMNGTFCKFDASEGLAYVNTPDYFQYKDSSVEGTDVNVWYISSAAVAVFDENTVGREQITVSIGLKEKGQDDYWFLMGTMGGYDYNDTVKNGEVSQYGYTESIYSTAFDRKAFDTSEYDYHDKDDYPVSNKGNGEDQFLNHLVVAVDIEQDGIIARYHTKNLIYTDPNLVSVLQAAPYFGELSGTEGSTAYEIGVEYTIGEQSSESTSFSIGISAEAEGPGIKTSIGAGYNTSWSKSFEESVTESYSTTFEAGKENVVVLQRTPIVVYRYQILANGKNQWGNNEIQVSVPAEPIYVLLPVDEYNAFADDFNARLKASDENYSGNRLNKIVDGLQNADSLLGNEGNPDMYIKSWSGITGAKNLSSATYGVSTATGSITSSYSASSSETEGSERSQGFYVNASIGTGANFLVGSAYVGVETSVEGEWTVGSYTTTTSYSAVSGTVSNLGNADEDIPSNILSQYGFSWTFGTWEIALDNDNPNIPVYGFQVTGVTRPTNAPQNLKAEHGSTESQVVLSWDAVAGATGYIVYSYDISGARSEVGRIAPTSGTPTTEFTYTIDNSIPFYTFAVSAITGTSTEGAMSSKVFYYPQSSGIGGQDGITPQLRINSATNEWEVSYDGGATWASLGVKATGEDGKDGADGQDGAPGQDGSNGIDGITPQFQINPDTNMWEVSYDDGVTWASLEVKATGENGTDGAPGSDGDDGIDGITPQLRVNPDTNMWEASYDNGASWSSLGVKATGEKGEDGREVEFNISAAHIQWRYVGETEWNDLIALELLKGADGQNGTDGTDGNNGIDGADGIDGRNIELQTTATHIQWRYVGETAWNNLVSLADIKGIDGLNGTDGKDGADGKDGLTPFIGENGNWWIGTTDTGISAVGADGEDGEDGREVEFNISATHIQWHYVGETEWNDLIALELLKGADGQNGTDGTDGNNGIDGADGIDGRNIELQTTATHIQWRYVGETAWNNLVSLADIKGIDGLNGTDGKDGADGKDGLTPFIGENGNWWIGTTDTGISAVGADGKDGTNGKDGNGIVDIKFNENGDLIFTMTDGSTINAGKAPAGVSGEETTDSVKTMATVAVAMSGVTLLWNVIALAVTLFKKKRI